MTKSIFKPELLGFFIPAIEMRPMRTKSGPADENRKSDGVCRHRCGIRDVRGCGSRPSKPKVYRVGVITSGGPWYEVIDGAPGRT